MNKDNSLAHKRALYKRQVRQLLDSSGLLEVDVPLLAVEACPDPSSLPIKVPYRGEDYYLQPSPEYFIKRLIAQEPGNYYALAPCFRDDPVTRFHNPEFMMLEYYLLGDSFEDIKELTCKIISIFLPTRPVEFISYSEVFRTFANICPETQSDKYSSLLDQHGIDHNKNWSPEILEDLIFSTLCQPHLGGSNLTFVQDFPFEHRALAHFDQENNKAMRFEVFINGVEVANGYQECICPKGNKDRIQSWEKKWHSQNLRPPKSDKFLEAADHLPPCSGVAMGFDRLISLACDHRSLNQSLLFPWEDL